ncbi:LysM peptidoglycan-binding domain-containing protein [Candidatus Peregrinibacteria bacterium]|nr:LysM peptidoglycan-binding domain-containing protein [Candidatus Peregrinibacteria bacterium]
MKKPITFLLTLILVCINLTTANASLTLTPNKDNPTLDFKILAGYQDSGFLDIKNTSSSDTIEAEIYAVDSTRSIEGYFAAKSKTSVQDSLGKWTTLTPSTISIEPGQTEKVEFNIKLPKDLTPGTYSGAFVVTKANKINEIQTNSTAVNITTRVAYPFFVQVPGDIKIDYNIYGFTLDQQKALNTFKYQIENNGNIALKVKPKLTIKDSPNLFYNKELEAKTNTLYKDEKIENQIRYFDKPFIGHFNANLKVDVYQYNIIENEEIFLETFTLQTSFWVIPWQFILLLIVLVIIYITIHILIVKQQKNIIKKADKYITQSGDTIHQIANKYNCNWKKIAKINKIKPPYAIDENTELLIPNKCKKNASS